MAKYINDEALKKYRDTISVFEGVRMEGRVEGSLEEKIAIARNLKSMGMSISDVSKATGLQEEEIKALWIYCNSIGFIGTGTSKILLPIQGYINKIVS